MDIVSSAALASEQAPDVMALARRMRAFVNTVTSRRFL
jgi:hypothetical protein